MFRIRIWEATEATFWFDTETYRQNLLLVNLVHELRMVLAWNLESGRFWTVWTFCHVFPLPQCAGGLHKAGAAAFKAHLAAQKKKDPMPCMLENCWKTVGKLGILPFLSGQPVSEHMRFVTRSWM